MPDEYPDGWYWCCAGRRCGGVLMAPGRVQDTCPVFRRELIGRDMPLPAYYKLEKLKEGEGSER